MSGIRLVIGGVVVLLAGVGVWLAAPLFYDTEVQEPVPSGVPSVRLVPSAPVVSSAPPAAPATTTSPAAAARVGVFSGFDALHQAAGTAQLVQATDGTTYVRFEDDFTVTNGPDLYVHLGRNGAYDATANLGRLKGTVGSQNYVVPADIDVSAYDEVWVWCRAFSVPFGKAVLQ